MPTTTPFSAAAWLDAWEAAATLAPGLREARLLGPACGADVATLARAPIGVRDRLLLDLRRALFGPWMECTAFCPHCGEYCEWQCSVDALRVDVPAAASGDATWRNGGWEVRFRLLTGLDVAAAQDCADAADAERMLLQRCVLSATYEGRAVVPAEIPAAVAAAVGEALAEADPQAAPTVGLSCPACEESWEADLDLGAFLWTELDAWARRTLGEVHVLATRCGWPERDILAMSPSRRATYVAMVEQ